MLLREQETPSEKTHAPYWCLDYSQKVAEFVQNIEGLLFRGVLLKKFVGAGGVHLLKTIHKKSGNKRRSKMEIR